MEGLMFRRFPVALLLIGLLASADATPDAPLVAEKAATESAFESNYVAEPTSEAMGDGMDAALDMLVQIQPSSETMKAVQAAQLAMKGPSKVVASKNVMVQEKFVPVGAGEGIYSASVDPSDEEQEGAMDSVFDMLVQLPDHKHDGTAKLKRTLEKKEEEVRALKAKIAAKAKKPHHKEAKKATRAPHHVRKHNKDSSVEELDENKMGVMDADDVEEEREDEENVKDDEPEEEVEDEDWSPAKRSIAPLTQPKATPAVVKKKPVVVDSGLERDPEADSTLAAVNARRNARAAKWARAARRVRNDGGETSPNTGNILNPAMHVMKPTEVRAVERKDSRKAKGRVLKKEFYKMVDANNPREAAKRAARRGKGNDSLKRIEGVQANGQTQVWLLGCSGNPACVDQFDDAS